MTQPLCSVVVPCRDEIRTIEACLDSLLAGDYPVERTEILVVDGGSTDGTREVLSRYAERHSHVTVLNNQGGVIPVSMNMGIHRARGTVILKADAHAVYPRHYVRRSVEALVETGADNVGGIIDTCAAANTITARAIAGVLAHPFGSGNSRFRTGASAPIEADTVAFGCYRRETLERMGGYNEALVRSSDMDLNTRIRRAGGRIVLFPDIVARYYPRAAFWPFLTRNVVDGFWATYPLRFGGQVLRLRHATPLLACASLPALVALSVLVPQVAWLALAPLALYVTAVAIASMHLGVRGRSLAVVPAAAAVFIGRHAAYALGSLWGLIRATASREFWVRRDGARPAVRPRPSWPVAHVDGTVSIVIPALNEERRLPPAIAAIDAYLQAAGVSYEIIVVDDGSTDGTAAIVRKLAAGRTNLRLIRFPHNRGKGAAVKAGLLAGIGQWLVFTDADQSTSIDQLPKLLGPMADGFDVAMGSRGLADSTFEAKQRWYRRKLGNAFGVLTRLVLVRGFRDCQCGFKAFTRRAAIEIFSRLTSPTAIFDAEVLLLSARLGFRVAEVPVGWRHDPDSRLRYDCRRAFAVLVELLRLRRQWGVLRPPRAAVTQLPDRGTPSAIVPGVLTATHTEARP